MHFSAKAVLLQPKRHRISVQKHEFYCAVCALLQGFLHAYSCIRVKDL